MVEALVMMGGLGLVVGCGLAVASKIFYVYVDPKILAVEEALPGANCGGCGLPGCSANAEAIVMGRAAPNSCVAAGAEVAEAIARIMGVSIEAKEPDIARPGCYYGIDEADLKFVYAGVADCRAAVLHGGGMKVCRIGCVGLGTCARSCPFDAITMGPDGLPVVDEVRCTGCGTCERVCPKHIITLSSVTRRILKEYTTEECTTPCQRACPAGIDIREYILQVANGNPERAVQVIKERNPFPSVIGRICPRPCETECRRNFVDEAVAINFIKRYAGDTERERGRRILPFKAPDTGRRIAVVGGGVAGLSAAFFSARLGHLPTVYEAAEAPGGLLRTAIAAYRLPQEILDWDIDGVREMGVAIETRKTLGKDISVASLFETGFDAVLVASGGWDSRLARQGEIKLEQALPGVLLLVDFLKFADDDRLKEACRSDVIIAGGGGLALEAGKMCREQGAKSVTVVFREPQEEVRVAPGDLEAAQERGVAVIFGTAVSRISGEGDRLVEVETTRLADGLVERREARTLIIAAGRTPELILTKRFPGSTEDGDGSTPSNETAWEGILPYKPPVFKGQVGMLAPGDPVTDFSAAIRAIGAGRRLAASVHQMMYGIGPALPENVLTPDADIQDVDHVENVASDPRRIMPLADSRELDQSVEIEKGFTPETASEEARRCLQCGLICYRRDDALSEERAVAVRS
ncbi:MAG: FAD-dependent oxidoreductase [Deltaproteobacteria bacterium]|nr:FAD-dependent oxidoreductase [Deltaproteobacteria bacterium]